MKRYSYRRPSLSDAWHEVSVVRVVQWIEQSGRPAEECWNYLDSGGLLTLGDFVVTRQLSASEAADAARQSSFVDVNVRPGPAPVRQFKLF